VLRTVIEHLKGWTQNGFDPPYVAINLSPQELRDPGFADSVHEVIELDPTQINPPPTIAMRWRSEFIQGMGKRGDEFIIIRRMNKVDWLDGSAPATRQKEAVS